MNQSQALRGFAALSQETRLAIVRLLVRAGPDGLAAGAVAEAVDASPSNVSFHLKDLEHAGLITARRESRSIIYAADYERIRALLGFLTEDCCQGRPDASRTIGDGPKAENFSNNSRNLAANSQINLRSVVLPAYMLDSSLTRGVGHERPTWREHSEEKGGVRTSLTTHADSTS